MKKRTLWSIGIVLAVIGVAVLLTPLVIAGREVGVAEVVSVAPLSQTDDDEDDAGAVVTATETVTTTVVTAVTLSAANEETPAITHGPLSGEVGAETAVLWARGNQDGELIFTVATITDTEFVSDTIEASVVIDETTDWTGEVEVSGLEAGQQYHFRVALAVGEELSDFVQGSFGTAPMADEAAAFNFVFGSCLGGQGYCRDPETGWEIFNTMQAENPDLFLITGDSVYVDSACTEPDNVAGAEGPYQDLDGFHTRYRYHLGDEHYASFLAQTPIYVTWDDHEIVDDFGGPELSGINAQLFAEGTQAFFDYWPLQASDTIYRSFRYGAHAEFILLDTRSYRDPNVNWDPHPRNITPKTMLGEEQFAWLQQTLAESTATWKFIVTSTPLSYPTGFPQPEVDGRDGWANYTEKSGYETELMSLLFFVEAQDVQNVVFLTGDTHWPFALSYDPDRDGEVNFYEFGSSPISAINLPPVEKPDPTFNPTVLYAEGEFLGTMFNFGHVMVDEAGMLTFRIIDREGVEHYAVTIAPEE